MGVNLPVPSQQPGQNAQTEQGQGDNRKRQRRQPDWYVVHIEWPDKYCNYNVASEAPSRTARLKLMFTAAISSDSQCECDLPGNKRQ